MRLAKESTAIIILNCPLSNTDLLEQMCQSGILTVCADGGANRLYDAMIASYPQLPKLEAVRRALPIAIHGDLDSIRDDVYEDYQRLDVKISKKVDYASNDNDLNKCVTFIEEYSPRTIQVILWRDMHGRIDQSIRLLHELCYEQRRKDNKTRLLLFHGKYTSLVIPKDSAIIQVEPLDGSACSSLFVAPIYGPSIITTDGLETDVGNCFMSMQGYIKAMERIRSQRVSIRTSHDILLSIEGRVLCIHSDCALMHGKQISWYQWPMLKAT